MRRTTQCLVATGLLGALLLWTLPAGAVQAPAATGKSPPPTKPQPPTKASPGGSHAGPNKPAAEGYSQNDIFRFMEEELDVTTASQLKTKLREVPQPVYVITADEIRRLAPTSIADILRHIPGGIVTQPTSSQWGVSVHIEPLALLNNYLLVLVDGRHTDMPFANVMQWWPLPVAPEDIQRVEVVLGPSSTLYGANAVFGVINFITKKARKDATGFTAAGGGSLGDDRRVRLGDVHLHVSRTQIMGRVRLRAAAAYDRLTPWDNVPILVDGRLRPPVAAQRLFATTRTAIAVGKATTFNVYAGAATFDSNYFAFSRGELRGDDEYVDGQLVSHNLWHAKDRLELRLNGRRYQMDLTSALDPALPPAPFNVQDFAAVARAQYSTPLAYGNRLVAGAEAVLSYSDWALLPLNRRTLSSYAVFAQDEYRPFEPLIITAGARVEKQHRPDTPFFQRLEVIPRASVVWLVSKHHTLRVSYGEGVRYPSPLENYGRFTLYDGQLTVYQSTGSLPDRTNHAVEVGYRGQLTDSLVVTASYSLWLNTDLFWVQDVGNGPLPVEIAPLAGTERRQSLDVTASWRPTERLRLDFVASTLFGGYKPPVMAARSGKDPPYRFSARLYLTPIDRLDVDFGALLVAPRQAKELLTSRPANVAGWLDVDMHISWQLLRRTPLAVYLAASNITNTIVGSGVPRQLPEPDTISPGRRLMLGLRGKL